MYIRIFRYIYVKRIIMYNFLAKNFWLFKYFIILSVFFKYLDFTDKYFY